MKTEYNIKSSKEVLDMLKKWLAEPTPVKGRKDIVRDPATGRFKSVERKFKTSPYMLTSREGAMALQMAMADELKRDNEIF